MARQEFDLAPDDQRVEPPGRGFVRFVIAALVAFVLVEGAVRVVEAAVSDDQLYASSIDAHARQLRDGRTPDVLIVGSSSAGAAVWAPRLVDAGAACDAYSIWLEGPTMEDIERYVTHTFDDLAVPDQALLGVTMREFNANSTKLDNDEVDGFLETDRADGVLGVLHDQLALIRLREIFQDPPRLGRAVLGAEHAAVDSAGHHTASLGRVIAQETEQHRQQEIDEMAEFELRDADLLALEDLIGYFSDRGAEVTVVNLPVTDVFIEFSPNGIADYQQYLDGVQDVASRTGTAFFDGQAVPFDTPIHFADVNHLNDDGARVFTDALIDGGVLAAGEAC